MGRAVYNALSSNPQAKAVCGVDKFANPSDFSIPVFKDITQAANLDIDCIIDFSVKEAIGQILPFALEKNIACVLATTGYNAEEINYINSFADKLPLFYSGNMSLGVNIISKLVRLTSAMLGDKADIEIIEAHHNQKIDAPSGTALMLLDAVQKGSGNKTPVYGRDGIVGKRKATEIGIHAVRGGSIVGKHEVMFILDNEVITIKHEAESKTVFALGAISAALFLAGKAPGIYDMTALLSD